MRSLVSTPREGNQKKQLNCSIKLWRLLDLFHPTSRTNLLVALEHFFKVLQNTQGGHGWPVFAIAFSPKGQLLATGGDDRTIKLWHVNTGQLMLTVDA
ncbi:hypothetical protein H6F90_06895 [Trichocoleus sp. FACHB-591]|nr:hypothetical protein [Trichocoleus sp. FACHB-591]